MDKSAKMQSYPQGKCLAQILTQFDRSSIAARGGTKTVSIFALAAPRELSSALGCRLASLAKIPANEHELRRHWRQAVGEVKAFFAEIEMCR